jgi:hypothetical protein
VIRRLPVLGLLAFVGACDENLPRVYPDPTSLQTSDVRNGIRISVLSPVSSLSENPEVEMDLQVDTEQGDLPADWTVLVGPSAGLLLPSQRLDPTRTVFRRRVPLAHGRNEIRVEVRGPDGRLLRDASFVLRYDGTLPGISILGLARPGEAGCADAVRLARPLVNTDTVCVIARASAAAAWQVQSVQVETDDGSIDATPGDDGRHVARVPLRRDALNTLRVRVTDQTGNRSGVTFDVAQDSTPPRVEIRSPGEARTSTDQARWVMTGSASDALGLDALRVETLRGGVTFLAPTLDWSFEVRLAVGENPVAVVATDRAGNETRAEVVFDRDRTIRLRLPESDDGLSTVLRLGRTALQELVPEQDRRTITLVDVPLRPVVLQSLRRIANPLDFGVDTSRWGQAERNLAQLLSTTPDTVSLVGTSLESMAGFSDAIGLPVPRLLAQMLDIAVTDPVLEESMLADILLEQLVASHPRVDREDGSGEPVVRLTMEDALTELRTLSERYGPAGDHPGFLDGAIQGAVLEPGFAIRVRAQTSLRPREGIDTRALGKDYLYLREGASVVSFDFGDPETFDVVGLVADPTIDLRIQMLENDAFIPAGTERNSGLQADGAFRGNSPVWELPPWELESIVAHAAWVRYRDLFAGQNGRRELRYRVGSIENAAVLRWDRGWVEIETAAGLGNPPPPFYAWDLLTEVAQVRLHDGGLEEGEVVTAFDLEDMPVGIEADAFIASVRPNLEAQSERLAQIVLGEGALSESFVDVYLMPDADPRNRPWLFFRAEGDADNLPDYPRPGFFEDAALMRLVSTTDPRPGQPDATHHKVQVEPGLTVYIANPDREVVELRVVRVDARGADVVVQRQGVLP